MTEVSFELLCCEMELCQQVNWIKYPVQNSFVLSQGELQMPFLSLLISPHILDRLSPNTLLTIQFPETKSFPFSHKPLKASPPRDTINQQSTSSINLHSIDMRHFVTRNIFIEHSLPLFSHRISLEIFQHVTHTRVRLNFGAEICGAIGFAATLLRS